MNTIHAFQELSKLFEERFNKGHFPEQPETLYNPAQFILQNGGKRIRPVLCLMGNELFDEITENAYNTAIAIELFHNFTLIHDDIMDKAPLRRGQPTVHTKFSEPQALLAGDVMLVYAYQYLNKIKSPLLNKIMAIFNKVAIEVCEGQQLDMDYEQRESICLQEYKEMITLKTSVLLAGSLQMGAVLGGGSEGNCNYIYEFGKNLGIAFQIQDDLLDAFGNPEKFGKQPGGDILVNKKTFLLVKALELCNDQGRKKLNELLTTNPADKVERVLEIFKDCKVDEWAAHEKAEYAKNAYAALENIAVLSSRKKPLKELADYLLERQH